MVNREYKPPRACFVRQATQEDESVSVCIAAESPDLPYEQTRVAQVQVDILEKMEKNRTGIDQMRRDVSVNIWRDSLDNWAKSF